MTSQTIHRVGLDIGFGDVKAALICPDDKLSAVSFPAVTGHAQALSNYTTGLGRAARRRATRMLYQGVEYYVGDDVLRHSSSTQAGRQDPGRIGSAEERILALAALARLGVEHACLVTGLPVLWFEQRRKLINSLKGEHCFIWGRQPKTIVIHRVIVLPQPFGGFYAHVLNQRGLAAIPEEEILRTYACLDVGWNTTDMSVIRSLEPVDEWQGGAQVGVRNVMQLVGDAIRHEYGLDLAPREVEQAIRSRQVESYGQFHDIGSLVASITTNLAQKIVSSATELWGSGQRMSQVLVFGGGGGYFGAAIRATFPRNSVVLPRPALANAVGFCYYARRNIWPERLAELFK